MQKIGFLRSTHIGRAYDAAYVIGDEDPRAALVEQVIESISTDVEIKLGDVKIHLAALMNPDHWSEDWLAAGVEDADAFIASQMEDDQ